MAQYVDTEGAEGSQPTTSTNEVDEDEYIKLLNEKLNEKNLSKILKAFESEEITATDLICHCSENDIRDMIEQDIKQNNSIKISVKEKIKFIRIVKTIQHYRAKKEVPAVPQVDDTFSNLKRMISINKESGNKVDSQSIVDLFDNHKNLNFSLIFQSLEDEENTLDLEVIFDVVQFCSDNKIDITQIFGKNYSYFIRFYKSGIIRKQSKKSKKSKKSKNGKTLSYMKLHEIVSFMVHNIDILEKVCALADDDSNKLDLKSILDAHDFCNKQKLSAAFTDAFGAKYSDLKRMLQYKAPPQKANWNDLRRVIRFLDMTKNINLQNVYDLIDDVQNELELGTALDLFDFIHHSKIDIQSVFGNNYSDLKDMIILARDHQMERNRVFKFMNKAKAVNSQNIAKIVQDKNNDINLEKVFSFVEENNVKDFDFKRGFDIGGDVISTWDDLQSTECKLDPQIYFTENDSDTYVKHIKSNTEQLKKKVNEQHERIKKQMAVRTQRMLDIIELESSLYIKNIEKYASNVDTVQQLTETYLKYVTDKNQSIADARQKLQKFHVKVIENKARQFPKLFKSPMKLDCSGITKHFNYINYKFQTQSTSVLKLNFKPVKLKCEHANGNIVHLSWAEPWNNEHDDRLRKLNEFKRLKWSDFSFEVRYCEKSGDKEEKANDTEDNQHLNQDLNWMKCKFSLREKAYNKCYFLLENNKEYKIKIKYICRQYGSSAFSDAITVKTGADKPLTKDIQQYKAIWSDKFRSKNVTLNEDNTVATSSAKATYYQCIRAQFELKKNTKVMFEFLTANVDIGDVGVIRRDTTNESDNDIKNFRRYSADGFYALSHGEYNYDPKRDILNPLSIGPVTDVVKIIADWCSSYSTTPYLRLLYIVNGLILYNGNQSPEFSARTCYIKDQHVYPAAVMKKAHISCEIRNVSS